MSFAAETIPKCAEDEDYWGTQDPNPRSTAAWSETAARHRTAERSEATPRHDDTTNPEIASASASATASATAALTPSQQRGVRFFLLLHRNSKFALRQLIERRLVVVGVDWRRWWREKNAGTFDPRWVASLKEGGVPKLDRVDAGFLIRVLLGDVGDARPMTPLLDAGDVTRGHVEVLRDLREEVEMTARAALCAAPEDSSKTAPEWMAMEEDSFKEKFFKLYTSLLQILTSSYDVDDNFEADLLQFSLDLKKEKMQPVTLEEEEQFHRLVNILRAEAAVEGRGDDGRDANLKIINANTKHMEGHTILCDYYKGKEAMDILKARGGVSAGGRVHVENRNAYFGGKQIAASLVVCSDPGDSGFIL